MAVLRSALFALVFYGWTAIAVFLAYPISLFGERAARGWAHSWARYHRWCCANILGIRSRIEGAPPKGAVLVAAKHHVMGAVQRLDHVHHAHLPRALRSARACSRCSARCQGTSAKTSSNRVSISS